MDYNYEFHLKSGVILNPNRCSRHGASLREHPFIVIGESSGSTRLWWMVTSLVFEVLNVASQFPPNTELLDLGQRKDQLPSSGHLEF